MKNSAQFVSTKCKINRSTVTHGVLHISVRYWFPECFSERVVLYLQLSHLEIENKIHSWYIQLSKTKPCTYDKLVIQLLYILLRTKEALSLFNGSNLRYNRYIYIYIYFFFSPYVAL